MKPVFSAIVPLTQDHNVQGFTCGDQDIDQYIKHHAAAEQAMRLNQIYVTTDSQQAVLAYFTLSPITVRVEPALLSALGLSGVPYPSVGGFLLGRLGVHMEQQKRGVGEALVMRASQIAKAEAAIVGGAFVAVDPKSDKLVDWYARQEFVRLGSRTRRMILPLKLVP